MAAVVVEIAVLRGDIVGRLRSAEVVRRGSDRTRVRVVHGDGRIRGKLAPELCLQSVIVGIEDRAEQIDGRIAEKWAHLVGLLRPLLCKANFLAKRIA